MSLTRRVGQQLFQRPKAEQLVDQHLLERELLAPVERDLQLGEHLADDRAEFLGELVLAERRRGFRVDALEQARKHLLLDAVDRSLEAFALAARGLSAGVLARREAVHCRALRSGAFGLGASAGGVNSSSGGN